MSAFSYSIGRGRFDVHPRNYEAESLRDFAAHLLRHRAPTKAQAFYVTAAMGSDGRRCTANAQPRRWLPLDVDGVDADVLPDWRMWLASRRGFGWPTASSTPLTPRERVILELGEPVTRAEGIAIGTLFARDVDAEFGTAVRLDKCTFRPEQPCFLPVGEVRPFYLLGDPLHVQTWLAQAPPRPPEPEPLDAPAAALADARVRALVATLHQAGLLRQPLGDARGYAMRCPWEGSHSTQDAPNSTATALLLPSPENGWRGAFVCQHAHCRKRWLGDLVRIVGLAEREAA